MKRIFYVFTCIVLILSVAIFSVGCKDKGETITVTHDFTLSETNKTMEIGETFTLVASYGDSMITFTSDDTDVVTVSDVGIVTALKAGKAYITVSSDSTDDKRVCEITVIDTDYSVSFNEYGEYSVMVGAYKNLAVKTLKNGVEYDGKVTWTVSSNDAKLINIDGRSATFVASKAGTYEVSVNGEKGGQAKLVITVVENI
jgi:uncharacterized protein YjdB